MRQVTVAHAHCDLYCGVYDPAQAKIEAMSVLKSAQKYHDSDDEVFRARAIQIKEERAELAKHHLMVLWADFFTADHRKEFDNLDDLFWRAIHQAGEAKKSVDPADGQKLVDLIDEIAEIFWKTDKAKDMGVYPPS
jgi:nickel superoxide dismutase